MCFPCPGVTPEHIPHLNGECTRRESNCTRTGRNEPSRIFFFVSPAAQRTVAFCRWHTAVLCLLCELVDIGEEGVHLTISCDATSLGAGGGQSGLQNRSRAESPPHFQDLIKCGYWADFLKLISCQERAIQALMSRQRSLDSAGTSVETESARQRQGHVSSLPLQASSQRHFVQASDLRQNEEADLQ